MNNYRTYGHPPFETVLVHGGPGAAGEMAPAARRLALQRGVLEPLQTAASLTGQVTELRETLETAAALPVVLVGYSWGAWLSLILAAQHASLVRKLVLVSSPAFEERYTAQLQAVRLQRLSETEQVEWRAVTSALDDPAAPHKDALLKRLGALASKADAYDPLPPGSDDDGPVTVRGDIFQSVWAEAAQWRRSGRLLRLAGQVRCPVTAIHGDTDPSPAEGVQAPLSTRLPDFRFILLERCGHTPWRERQAREAFFDALEIALEKDPRP